MIAPLIALSPVLLFLAALLVLDSYKLLRPLTVFAVLGCGAVATVPAYLVSVWVLGHFALSISAFSRYVAPVSEELAKGLIVVALVRTHRIGFLVDAAILGFAVGSGFAVIENLYYLRLAADAGMATWIVRGFGSALMHGGATALFAVIGLSLTERHPRLGLSAFVPGFIVAVLLHSAFNHLNHAPRLATLSTMLTLPPLMLFVFRHSEKALRKWIGHGFDADAQMLELIHSGRFADSPAGRYLHELRCSFKAPMAVDALCYLKLHTELSLRAKGLLMMREAGFEADILNQETKDSFAELRHLAAAIGPTGLRALQPLLHMRHRELWQLYLLESNR